MITTTEEQRSRLEYAMDFGHVITSHGDGTFEHGPSGGTDEVIYCDETPDGGASEPDLAMSSFSDEWRLLTGHTGQYGYHGAVMHPSEYIGGGLADFILTVPGQYVAVIVDLLADEPDESGETENVGWAIAYKGEGTSES